MLKSSQKQPETPSARAQQGQSLQRQTVPLAPLSSRTAILQMQQAVGNRAVVQLLSKHHAANLTIQRVAIVKEGARYREARTTDAAEKIQETREMSLQRQEELVKELSSGVGKNEKLLRKIQEDWKSFQAGSQVADLEELYAIGAQLDELEQNKDDLSKGDQTKLHSLALQLLSASEVYGEAAKKKLTDVYLYQQILSSLLEKVSRLDSKAVNKAMAFRGQALDQNISTEDRTAYRADIRLAGTWGGLAEANAGATTIGFTCDIFAIRNGRYQQVIRIGTGPQAAFNLLHLGNHYVVVQNAADGQPHNDNDDIVKTEEDGNCLYEALLLIRDNGVKMDAQTRKAAVATLRNQVAGNVSDDQIDASILEMRLSRQRAGIGVNMRIREATPGFVEGLLQRSQLSEYELRGLKEAAKTYLDERETDAGSKQTLMAYKEFEKAVLSSRKVKPTASTSTAEDGKDPEQRMREQALSQLDAKAVKKPAFHPDQNIITIEGEDFVLDRIGQLVRRFVVRNISPSNEQELKEHKSIYPSTLSPYQDTRTTRHDASGTGKNKIKDPSEEMVHVQGSKPSNYLSATTLQEGALNPQGEEFKSKDGKKPTTVRIDLAHISPTDIKALYSDEGIGRFLLDGIEGGEEEKAKILRSLKQDEKENAGKEKRAEGLAESNPALSEKEWQAVLDVVRTMEVLVSCEITDEAIEKVKKETGK